ncbi:MAG: AraC family transcriptional regulator [Paenibacillus sp.]|jgi:AraC-like DNA-binding protein|nr:AraC family transcriptional regulator [Paenibacillus sp.]
MSKVRDQGRGTRMNPQHPYRILTDYYYNWKGLKQGSASFAHTHPQYEIYYFHNGDCDYMLGERTIRLAPGDLIIMDGMTIHGPTVYEPSRYVRTMFSFDPYLVQIFDASMRSCDPLKPFHVLKNFHFRLSTEARAECEALLGRINRFYSQNDIIQFNRFLMAFYDLLIFIHLQARPFVEEKQSVDRERQQHVQRLIQYIELHFAEDLKLDDLVKHVHISKFHLMKLFREAIGKSITDYLYERRVNQAKLLFMCAEDISVTEACYEVGFKHVAHFSRQFKKQVGYSPETFKKLAHSVFN